METMSVLLIPVMSVIDGLRALSMHFVVSKRVKNRFVEQ